MDGIRPRRIDALRDPPPARQSEPQAGIGRHRKRRETLRRQEFDRHAELRRGARQRIERPHDAVDLGPPGIRRHQNAHQANLDRAPAM
jgi:hypothetical protein